MAAARAKPSAAPAKLSRSRAAMRAAKASCMTRNALGTGAWSLEGQFAVTQGLKVETAALEEYRRVLKIFIALTVEGTTPPSE